MSDLPSTARVVIIGGGAVGASVLYHLGLAGWTDCILLEKNELTAGSTWHAAGNIPTFSSSWAVMNMQRYSTELYRELGAKVDYPMNYHVTGSVRLAHSKNRILEFERANSMARRQGIDTGMMSVADLKNAYPFMQTHELEGGFWDPTDGDIDPAQLTQALAKGARDLGQKIFRFTPATGIDRDNGEWIVQTDKGDIRCDIVVNAAGYYAQRVGEWFKPYGGRTVPMMVMSHQYLLTEQMAELAAWSKEHGRKLPLLRDVDSSYYLRQENTGLNLGPYERNCKGHWLTPDDPMPDDFSFQLYPDDLDRLEWYIEDAMARVPLLGQSGISKVINGPIPYAPDGIPLIGPMPGVPNAFEACVFTFGIAQAGGAGKILSEWITAGETEWDCWSLDPRRYTDYTDHDYCVAKGLEVYGHEYAMHYPHYEWPEGRDKKLSPVHNTLKASGAQFGTYNGWERANWFAKDGDDTSLEAAETWARKGPWFDRVRAEALAVRDHVGVLDLPGYSRFRLTGSGAADWLRGRIAGGLPKTGRMTLAYFPTSQGRVLTEMSVIRQAEDEFTLITAAPAQWHDFDALAAHLPDHLKLTDITSDFSTLIVTGPKARDLLTTVGTTADLDLPWLSIQDAEVAGRACALYRVSFAGELGWELHAPPADIPALYEAVTAAGATPFGMYALNSLRIEKGYRAWKGDLSTDYSLLETGLDRFIKLDKKEEFPGKTALLNEKQQGSRQRFVTLVVDSDEFDPPYMSNIWMNGSRVGETTSSAYGFRVDACVALGMVQTELAVAGTHLEVEIYGQRMPASIQAEGPLWDPQNQRLKS